MLIQTYVTQESLAFFEEKVRKIFVTEICQSKKKHLATISMN